MTAVCAKPKDQRVGQWAGMLRAVEAGGKPGGDAVEPAKKNPDFFITFFIRLFRITFFDDFHHFCMPLFFMSLRNHTDFFYLSSFAPTTYINILGVAKDTCYCVFGTSTSKKMLGVSPSVRFFGVGLSRPRFGASSSRPELASARP